MYYACRRRQASKGDEIRSLRWVIVLGLYALSVVAGILNAVANAVIVIVRAVIRD